jgi:putative ABC transport system permease protein
MNIEDHILALVTKKLANEASEDELHELSKLLQQYPDINNNIKIMTEWWHDDAGQNTDEQSYLCFQKIMARIKADRFEK